MFRCSGDPVRGFSASLVCLLLLLIGCGKPGPASAPPSASAESYAEQGRRYWQQREFRRAAEAFEQALQHDPNNVDILLALIQTRQDAGDQRQTEALARRAVALAPQNPKALVYLGRYLGTLSERPDARREARDLLERAANLAPGMPIPLVEWGRLEQQEGNSARAETLLTAAWDLLHQGERPLLQLENMTVVEARRAETAYALALCYRAQGKRAEAGRWFERFRGVDSRIERRSRWAARALADTPDLEALLSLARMDMETGGAAEAVPLIRRAIAGHRDDPRVRDLAALLARKTAQPE